MAVATVAATEKSGRTGVGKETTGTTLDRTRGEATRAPEEGRAKGTAEGRTRTKVMEN